MSQGDYKNKPTQKVAATYSGNERAKSVEGVEASDLPEGGRGPVETDYGHESKRDVPQHHGGPVSGEDTGIRGDAAVRDADHLGGRKRN
jgi:hypothetical protein